MRGCIDFSIQPPFYSSPMEITFVYTTPGAFILSLRHPFRFCHQPRYPRTFRYTIVSVASTGILYPPVSIFASGNTLRNCAMPAGVTAVL